MSFSNFSAKGNSRTLAILLIVALLFIVPNILNFYADYLWFSSLGYLEVFIKTLTWKILTGFTAFVLFFVIVYGNYKIAMRRSEREEIPYFKYVLLFLSLVVGVGFSNWETVLKFLNQVPFNVVDPVFSRDISFYVFTLPFYKYLFSYVGTIIAFSFLVSGFVYFYKFIIGLQEERPFWESGADYIQKVKNKAVPHLFALSFLVFVLTGLYTYFYRYDLLFSEMGTILGAGYVDINVKLPLYTILSVVSVLVGLSFLLNIKLKNTKLFYSGIGLVLGILVLGNLYAVAVQQYVVEPDEFNKEKPYIERNIESTREAYNLDKVNERKLSLQYDLNRKDLGEESGTIDNIRLWDWRPLLDTYNELQVFRSYYTFEDVDIDRYNLNGDYREVMLSPREMDINSLPEDSQSWINKHLVYTHGYGVVGGPVSNISEEGLPEFYVKDIPPKNLLGNYSDKFDIKRPEIYYGEKSHYYVLTNTQTKEFDYPKGQDNMYSTYEGDGGIKLDSFLKRLAFATKLNSIQILISGSITSKSKVLLNRKVSERVGKIAPFLSYDDDRYMVVADGRLHWIQDSYTTTDRYPYSHRLSGFNYVRNSVKTVVDPYNGDVHFYIINKDPLVETYEKIFPELFRDISEMSERVQKHIRYPQDLFRVQTSIYSTYHMEDPRVFYTKEDIWKIPNEIYRGMKREMESYYIILNLPYTNITEEFVLMQPFIPRGKENMIGWMAARSDGENYGELITYFFSKQELTYGPMQIESRIDQNPDISEKMSLWGQGGSSVIRGNLLAIPIKNSMLYIEPVFLQGTSAGALPELKRVIVSYRDSISMEPTLKGAMENIFGKEKTKEEEEETGKEGGIPPTMEELINRASDHYERAQEALKEGDLSGYQDQINEVGKILSQLKD